ncbi:MAG: glycosyltransferase family 2 protein, partial [Ignavibacteriaceae bacterium]
MITLSMIVKNEEKHLANCLESVKDVVDEIALVDTGSTDNTIEIAKKYSAKIFYFEWINDFAAARNFALEHSSCDWILYLDADECLSKKSVHEIKRLTRSKKREAYKCIINNIDEINFRPSVMTYVRLFPNDKRIRFEGKVHEQIETALRKNNFAIKNSRIEIDHYGYNLSKDDLKKKAKRNLEILLKQYAETKSSYYAFHLGQTYVVLNEKEKAEEYFTFALQDVKLEKEYLSLAYRYIAINTAGRQNYPLALELINKSLQCDDEQPLALFAAANIYLKLGDANTAEKLSRKAFEVNRKYLNGEKTSNQNILIDELHLCYYGLEISLLSNNKELFNFFYKKYTVLNKTSGAGELELFDKLLNNKPIAEEKLAVYASRINASNIE